MSNLQVKNLPGDVDKRLHRYAREQHRSIRDIVIEAVRRELDRRLFVEDLRRRASTRLKTSAAELLVAERRARGIEP
jgi:hypothetical protein